MVQVPKIRNIGTVLGGSDHAKLQVVTRDGVSFGGGMSLAVHCSTCASQHMLVLTYMFSKVHGCFGIYCTCLATLSNLKIGVPAAVSKGENWDTRTHGKSKENILGTSLCLEEGIL